MPDPQTPKDETEEARLDFVVSVNRLLKAAEDTRTQRDRLLRLLDRQPTHREVAAQ